MPHKLDALEVIIDMHPDISSFDKICTTGWNISTKNDASKCINIPTDLIFFVSVITLYIFYSTNRNAKSLLASEAAQNLVKNLRWSFLQK